MSRADLLALTPESVAALANLGLVKRAQREIAAGQGPSLEEDEVSGLVVGRFSDGVETKLPRGVPLRDASCTCGAAGACRHRVAVVLAYSAWHAEQAAAAPATTPEESWSPAAFDDAMLTKLVGKRLFSRATMIKRTGVIVELAGGATPTAKLPTCAVRFHVPNDLAYARCDCQTAVACEHVVVAAWAFHRARERGSQLPCTIELGEGVASTTADAPLDEALRLAEYVVAEGVSHLTDADRPRFARARAALGASSALLWPATIVDDLEIAVDAYRARSARYRSADIVHLLASLTARVRAARSGRGELPKRYVLGSDEARETALDHVRLVALGARVFADGRARDAEVYLGDPDSGVVLVAAKRFTYDEDKEPDDGPALARRIVTGRVTLGTLAHGQLVTRAAKRQANHAVTLATTRTAQTSVAPSSGDWGSLPPELLVRDFGALAASLRERPPRVLRPRMLATGIRVLGIAEGQVLRVGYRPGDQELIAEIGDGKGGTIAIVRRYARAAPHALDVLARALDAPTGPRFIAGDVRLGPRGVEIEPTAIVTDRVLVPDLDEASSKLDSLPTLAPAPALPLHAALDLAQGVLEDGIHQGLAHPRGDFDARVAAAASALSNLGLAELEQRLRAVASRDPRAWLDAALRLELTREVALVGLEP